MTEQELSDYYDKRKARSDPNAASTVRNMKQRVVNEPETADEVQAIMQTVDICFCHYRRRLADPDNFASKYLVDGLVEAGLLRDDSPEFVNEVRHRQEKIPAWQEESILIELITP